MPIRGSVLRPSNSATSYVFVDRLCHNDIHGRVYNPFLKREAAFQGVYSLLKNLEWIFDALDFPQATHVTRVFNLARPDTNKAMQATGQKYRKQVSEVVEEVATHEIKAEPDGKGTFIIRVLYRQNATWQGSIQWVEGKKTQNFRSDLEMLKLIDDAVRTQDEKDDQAKWD